MVRLCKTSSDYGRGGGKRVTTGLDEMHGSKLPAENKIKQKKENQKRCKYEGARSAVGVGCRERDSVPFVWSVPLLLLRLIPG